MLTDCLHIGRAADADDPILRHATRLAITGNDSHGGGSATEVDEDETDDEKALREQAEADAGLDDPEVSRRSARQEKAYDELKSDRDLLRNDLETQKRENQEMRDRLTKIEGDKTSRETVNEQTNSRLERAKQRSRELMAEVSQIPADDPRRGEKVSEIWFTKFSEEQERIAQDISTRTAREAFQRELKLDRDQSEAKRVTLDALKAAGLDDEDYELVEALAIAKGTTDPGWFDRVAPEKQIDALVDIVKGRIVKTTRESQEFQDEKDRHRKPMRGVIDRGSQTRRVRDQEEEPDRTGPGSILEDMARAKRAKLQSTKVMLRQAER